MESETPKFNPEFSFLEDERILELDNMINEVIGSEINSSDRKKLLEEIKVKWNSIQKECIEKNSAEDIKNFLLFVSYNLRKMSAGGMNLGRSEISNFIDEKSKELTPYFEKFQENP